MFTIKSYTNGKTYPSVTHAVADLRDNPCNRHGFANSVFVNVGFILPKVGGDKLREMLQVIADRAVVSYAHLAEHSAWLSVDARLSGDGTVGGLLGHVYIALTVISVADALVRRAQSRQAAPLSQDTIDQIKATAAETRHAMA